MESTQTWMVQHRTWRKMHLAINTETLEIEAVSMTGNDSDDASQVRPLLMLLKVRY